MECLLLLRHYFKLFMASTKIQNNILFIYVCTVCGVQPGQSPKIFKRVYNNKWLSVVRFFKNALYVTLE